MVVSTHINGFSLGSDQLCIDLFLVLLQLLGHLGKSCLQILVLGLGSYGLRPVHGEVEMAPSVVDLTDLTSRVLVVLQELAVCLVEGLSQELGFLILEGSCQVLQGDRQRQELTERIPSQVPFLLELLDMLGSRAAGTRLEKPAASQKRHDRQHFRTGA